MTNKPSPPLPNFRPGDQLTANQLQQIVNGMVRKISGGKGIIVRTFGDQLIISQTPAASKGSSTPDASDIATDVDNFNNNLSEDDDTVQKALDTIDDLSLGGGEGGTGDVLSINKNSHGFSVGDAVGRKGYDFFTDFELADVDDVLEYTERGIITKVVDDDNFEVLIGGYGEISSLPGWAGTEQVLYLDYGNDGTLVSSQSNGDIPWAAQYDESNMVKVFPADYRGEHPGSHQPSYILKPNTNFAEFNYYHTVKGTYTSGFLMGQLFVTNITPTQADMWGVLIRHRGNYDYNGGNRKQYIQTEVAESTYSAPWTLNNTWSNVTGCYAYYQENGTTYGENLRMKLSYDNNNPKVWFTTSTYGSDPDSAYQYVTHVPHPLYNG